MIIDSHLHLPYNIPDLAEKKRALLGELKRNGVDMGIVIADSELESTIGSVRDCAELLRNEENIKIIAGISPLIAFETQLAYCRELLENGGIIGFKVYTGHEHFYSTDLRLFPVYDLAAEYDVPVLFHTGWDDPQYAAPGIMRGLAEKRPQNRFVYCHCFYPDTDSCFETLKDCPNVYFDTSSLADDPAKVPDIKASLERGIREMPERFIFGSDFASCSQEPHIRLAFSLDITAEQREMLMCGNAKNVYRLK